MNLGCGSSQQKPRPERHSAVCGRPSWLAAVGARGTIFSARISMTPWRAVPGLQILPCAPTAACLWLVSIHLATLAKLDMGQHSIQTGRVTDFACRIRTARAGLRHHDFSTLLQQAALYCSLHATASNLAAAASVLLGGTTLQAFHVVTCLENPVEIFIDLFDTDRDPGRALLAA